MLPNDAIHSDHAILGGMPVFLHTRVPVATLWDYLKQGETVEGFLADFPSVTKPQVIAVLEAAKAGVLHAHSH